MCKKKIKVMRKKKIKAQTTIRNNGQIVFGFQAYINGIINKHVLAFKPSCFFSLNYEFNMFYSIFYVIEHDILVKRYHG